MRIAIISLGWLGSSLYDFWEDQGHEVFGTYHSSPKLKKNEQQYDFNNGVVPRQVMESDLIFFNLPPSKIDSIDNYRRFINETSGQRIVFTSSTSVYGNEGIVNEDTTPVPETSNGKFLVELENLTLAHSDKNVVIRPAGLIGGDRHPGKFLSDKISRSHTSQKVNLIDREDLITLIDKAINQSSIQVLNVVNSHHPEKGQYYIEYCKKNGLALPEFKENGSYKDKIVETKYEDFKVKTRLP